MANGVNKVILIGNLGADPILHKTQKGRSVAEATLATNQSWTDAQGVKREKTEWHRIAAWGKTGENLVKYMWKGREVYLEGHLETTEYTDKEGVKRKSTKVVAEFIRYGANPGGVAGRGAESNGVPMDQDDSIPFQDEADFGGIADDIPL